MTSSVEVINELQRFWQVVIFVHRPDACVLLLPLAMLNRDHRFANTVMVKVHMEVIAAF